MTKNIYLSTKAYTGKDENTIPFELSSDIKEEYETETVIENDRYSISLAIDASPKLRNRAQLSADVYVNGGRVGKAQLTLDNNVYSGNVIFLDDSGYQTGKPFLMLYDAVIISVNIGERYERSTELEKVLATYYTKYIICELDNLDEKNIINILEKLYQFDNPEICDWVFQNPEKQHKELLLDLGWRHRSYKSITSYLQLIEDIAACYKTNLPNFMAKWKSTISPEYALLDYRKVNKITRQSALWINQNTDRLVEIPNKIGIPYQGKNLIPTQVKTEIRRKNWDNYDNRIVLGFLNTVALKCQHLLQELKTDAMLEARIFEQFRREKNGYFAPIITIKNYQTELHKKVLFKLENLLQSLMNLKMQYMSVFAQTGNNIDNIMSMPRMTKTFQEVNPYTQVFGRIQKWFEYGEYGLEKEKLLLRVKTVDKLFEYFCLLRLLSLLKENGYQYMDSFSFPYEIKNDKIYEHENDVNNTYNFKKDNIEVTLYYQAVISSNDLYNGLELYRITSDIYDENKEIYYWPDFILRFKIEDKIKYVILDAKFASKKNISKYHLDDIMKKYGCEVLVNNANRRHPVMVWALQGRMDSESPTINNRTRSSNAQKYGVETSYGSAKFTTLKVVSADKSIDSNPRIAQKMVIDNLDQSEEFWKILENEVF